MTTSGPLKLLTADHPASWLNRAGRIDRSACVELKASDLWRFIPEQDWQKHARHDRVIRKGGKPFLLAEAQSDITTYQLADLHDTQNPFTLQGDHRTGKSNALKPSPTKRTPRSPRIESVGSPSPLKPHLSGRSSNPNKGQSRTKMLGLRTDWSQTLTIQRWRLHANLAQHFFACPHCTKRALKLFLPLCTEQELHDANTVNLWLDSNQPRINRSSTLRPQASQLLARYAPIFPPRQLQCQKCLGMRYGEVKSIRS